MIRVSSYYVDQATTDFTVLSNAGFGSGISFTEDLGGERSSMIPRMDIYYRLDDNHRIDFSTFTIERDGRKTLSSDLDIGEESYVTNETLHSKIKYDIVKFAYSYSFYHSPQVELSWTFGLDTINFNISYSLEGGGKADTRGASAPLPLYGLRMIYRINRDWTVNLITETFFVEIENTLKGSLINNELSIEYKLLDQFSIGAGLTRVGTDLTVSNSGWRGSISDSHRGILLYGSYYF